LCECERGTHSTHMERPTTATGRQGDHIASRKSYGSSNSLADSPFVIVSPSSSRRPFSVSLLSILPLHVLHFLCSSPYAPVAAFSSLPPPLNSPYVLIVSLISSFSTTRSHPPAEVSSCEENEHTCTHKERKHNSHTTDWIEKKSVRRKGEYVRKSRDNKKVN